MTDSDIKAIGTAILDELRETNERLTAVDERLTDLDAKAVKAEEYEPTRKRLAIGVVVAIALALVLGGGGGLLGFRALKDSIKRDQAVKGCEQINDSFRVPLNGLLTSAKSSATRNPLPPDLTADQRAFYEDLRAKQQGDIDRWIALTQPVSCETIFAAGP